MPQALPYIGSKLAAVSWAALVLAAAVAIGSWMLS
jgi:hypothetical protein